MKYTLNCKTISLKLVLIKNIILKNSNVHFVEIQISRQLLCWKEYIKKNDKTIKNISQKDGVDAWIFFSDKLPELVTNIAMQPQFEKNIYIFLQKNDVLREECSLKKLHDFNLKHGITVNFLE